MNVTEAISLARTRIAEIFTEEEILYLGLEEVEFDELEKQWYVTMGFSRPWDEPRNALAVATATYTRRTYKIVRIADATGEVISVKNREVAE